MTLAWTKIKILTCKISSDLVHRGLGNSNPSVQKLGLCSAPLLFCRQSYWLFLEIFNSLKIRKSKILDILIPIFMSLHQSEVGSGDMSAACVLCWCCRLIGKIIQSCFIDISTSISVWSCDWRYVCNCWLTWQHYHLNIRLTFQKYCPLKG